MNLPIADNLKALRKRSHLSQEETAERVGVSRQTVAKWEGGETTPDLVNCAALAELYGVSLDDLVTFSGGGVEAEVPPQGKAPIWCGDGGGAGPGGHPQAGP